MTEGRVRLAENIGAVEYLAEQPANAPAATGRRRHRIPGTVAEVEASPTGAEIAAFFDFDGTLISGYSASVFATDRLRRRQAGTGGFDDLLLAMASSLRGRDVEDLLEVGERLFVQKIADRIYPEARELVAAHKQRCHTIVLLSSATRFQAAPIARELGIDHVVCNELETEDGRLTGAVRAPVVWGATKAAVAQKFATAHGVDVSRSYFYADGDEDFAFMYLVGHPRPTNPRRELERVARKRGWPILRFHPRGSVGPVGTVRNALGIAALGPVAAGGLAVGLATRSRRSGVNFLLATWIDSLFLLTGVKLNVQGREHAWSHRPAVFIFNHRNNFDVFMAGRVVERDLTAVGKKELAKNPLSAGLGKLIDAVFLERDNTQADIDALQPVQEAVQKGLSLLVSPEGTRSAGRDLGPFKKGPFRIAMAAGVPIVPIVIRNADDVGPRGATFMRPATVDLCVLPPIPIGDWTLSNLSNKIAAVRQQFAETLADWPDGA